MHRFEKRNLKKLRVEIYQTSIQRSNPTGVPFKFMGWKLIPYLKFDLSHVGQL